MTADEIIRQHVAEAVTIKGVDKDTARRKNLLARLAGNIASGLDPAVYRSVQAIASEAVATAEAILGILDRKYGAG